MAQKLFLVLLSVFLLVQYCQSHHEPGHEGGHEEEHGKAPADEHATKPGDQPHDSSPSSSAHASHGKISPEVLKGVAGLRSSGLRVLRAVNDSHSHHGGSHGK